MSRLKLALVTDIHYGLDRGSKKGSEGLKLLHQFAAFVEKLKPDVCLEMGDRTTSAENMPAYDLMCEVGAAFKKIPGKLFHLVGNHDLEDLTLEENEKALGKSLASASLDCKGYRLIFWNTHPKLHKTKGFTLNERDLDWLKRELKASKLPTIVFSHVPLDNGAIAGNYYFEKYPNHAGYPPDQAARIREVIEHSGKVILCVNGHFHWTAYHCMDGIHYVTIPSLVETFRTSPKAQGAYARVEIGEVIEIEIYGSAPLLYRLPIKKLGSHWDTEAKGQG